jgi:hypothetical protein
VGTSPDRIFAEASRVFERAGARSVATPALGWQGLGANRRRVAGRLGGRVSGLIGDEIITRTCYCPLGIDPPRPAPRQPAARPNTDPEEAGAEEEHGARLEHRLADEARGPTMKVGRNMDTAREIDIAEAARRWDSEPRAAPDKFARP